MEGRKVRGEGRDFRQGRQLQELVIDGRIARIGEIGHRHGRKRARLDNRLRRRIWERGWGPSLGKNGEPDRRIEPARAEAVAADRGTFVAEITFAVAIVADPIEGLHGPLAGGTIGIEAGGAGEDESDLFQTRSKAIEGLRGLFADLFVRIVS
jgi:hypothetical protein